MMIKSGGESSAFREAKQLGVPSWFFEYYSSEVGNLEICLTRKTCISCGQKPRSTTRGNQAMARHYATHLENKVPCQNCSMLFSNDGSLSRHRRSFCAGKSELLYFAAEDRISRNSRGMTGE
jgi:hypothetical protein